MTMRDVPCFICFEMATPARVVWVIVGLFLVFFAAGAWLTLHPFPLESAARSSCVTLPVQAAATHLDHAADRLTLQKARPKLQQ
jgi:hypothetical protein